MRLQSAVFTVEDTLLERRDGAPCALREGAEEVLSLLKMEGVWMFAVTALPRREAEQAMREAGLEGTFRGLLSTAETVSSRGGTVFEKAARRLLSSPRDTVVFTGRLASLREAMDSGFRAVAVRGAADAPEWEAMCAAATDHLDRWADYLA